MKVWSLLIVTLFVVNLVRAQDLFVKKEAKMTIPWAVADWSPYYILNGPQKGEGRMDRLKKVIAEHLPNYQFSDVYADMPRAVELWKLNKNICSGSALITPEREKWAYFTALGFQVPHEYVFVTSKADLYSETSDHPSLKDLLEKKNLSAIFTENRSYGPAIDLMVKQKSKTNPGIHQLRTSEGYMSLLKMVHKGRYDYTIEYEPVVRDFNETVYPEKPLFYKPLKEVYPSTVLYFACTKNEWGKKVITQVDQALQKAANSKEYQNAVESWLDVETVKRNRKALEDFYHRRAQGPWNTVVSGGSLSGQ
ncbi:TIGR02285 family protein [Bdellovibrio sp. HCB-162]|uniref:TIGR02285 family protein n=1 Tax=Bdellovibrio sp. HCB-162 TaxID=3394234 RepID=UPI0039BCD608